MNKRQRPARPARPARPKAKRKKKPSKPSKPSGRRFRITWWETNETGYEVELKLRHCGVKTWGRKVNTRGSLWTYSVQVPYAMKGWAEEVVFVMQKRVPCMDIRKLEPATRRRMQEKEEYKPKRTFQDKAVKSGGGPIDRLSETILDGLAFGGPVSRRKNPFDET